MNTRNYFKTTIALVVLTIISFDLTAAQPPKFPEPRQEKLLNGLKLLIWNEPQSPKVTVKLRVHNGAAFDPKDKMGVMALLSDILFPNEQAKAYFAEDLEGSLDVATNYDYIQITATGKAEEIQAILETLATAVTNPQITTENFVAVRNARLEKVKELEKKPAYVADQAVAKRLFGDYPYGRGVEGTAGSLAKIDKADLMFARDRFFTADNATLAIIGNVNSNFVYRATRQLFGAWKKSETKIPATFRLPDAPTAGKHFVEFPNHERAEIRQASRGAARNSKEFSANLILTNVLLARLAQPENNLPAQISVSNTPQLLYSTFAFGISVPAERASEFTEKVKKSNFLQPVSPLEFEKSKAAKIAEWNGRLSDKSSLAEFWLDADTYKLPSVSQQFGNLQAVVLSDVNNALISVKNAPSVSIAVGDPVKLKDLQNNLGQIAN